MKLNRAVRVVVTIELAGVLILRRRRTSFCAGDDLRDSIVVVGRRYWQVRLYQETVQIIENLTAITIRQLTGVARAAG